MSSLADNHVNGCTSKPDTATGLQSKQNRADSHAKGSALKVADRGPFGTRKAVKQAVKQSTKKSSWSSSVKLRPQSEHVRTTSKQHYSNSRMSRSHSLSTDTPSQPSTPGRCAQPVLFSPRTPSRQRSTSPDVPTAQQRLLALKASSQKRRSGSHNNKHKSSHPIRDLRNPPPAVHADKEAHTLSGAGTPLHHSLDPLLQESERLNGDATPGHGSFGPSVVAHAFQPSSIDSTNAAELRTKGGMLTSSPVRRSNEHEENPSLPVTAIAKEIAVSIPYFSGNSPRTSCL